MIDTTVDTQQNKIMTEDLDALKQYRDKWIELHCAERFSKGELDGFKSSLYKKYGVDRNDYFIDGETGNIRKRCVSYLVAATDIEQ